MMRMRWLAGLMAVTTLAACGGDEAPEATDVAGEMGPAGAMAPMGEMQMGGGMMEQMQAHLRAMEGQRGDAMVRMMPQHRQMVANMIAQMNREMREMNMPADAEWSSTVEAVREDLRRLPDMGAHELEAFMPEHRGRVARLMEMHRSMMGDMQM